MSKRRTAIEPVEPRLLFADNPDLTFGAGGYAIVQSPTIDFADMEVMSDDRIVAIGEFRSPGGEVHFAAVRWTADGVLDTTFSSDGIATTDLLPTGDSDDGAIPSRLAIQGDGKPIVAGNTTLSSTVSGIVSFSHALALVRYNINGSLDTTFSSDGIATLPLNGGVGVRQVDTLSTGKIAIFASYSPTPGTHSLLFARFNANGSVDTTFGGGDGWTDITAPAGEDIVDAEILPDGKVVAINGVSDSGLHVYRWNLDGTPDTSFAGDGRGEYFASGIPIWQAANDLAIDADGKVVVAGRRVAPTGNETHGAVARIASDGTVDTSFGGFGIVFGNSINGPKPLDDIAIAPNGDINLKGGESQDLLYRIGPDGLGELIYSAGVAIGGDHFSTGTIATQSDGHVILGGAWYDDPDANTSKLAIGRVSESPIPFDDGFRGTAVISGTDGDDVVTISESEFTIDWVLNGVSNSVLKVEFDTLRFDGGDGDDSLDFTGGRARLIVNAGDGNDTINAGLHSDSIDGGAGDDLINASEGDNTVIGGAGDDSITASFGHDHLSGADDNDTVLSGPGRDTLFGDAGDDSLNGDEANDSLVGGAGNDTLKGWSGDDLLFGSDGNDFIDGEGDDDTLRGELGADTLWGGSQKDVLLGGDGPDLLSGNGGNDRMAGEGGHDRLYGGRGDDQLDGGGGNDRLHGDDGTDKLFAGPGRNTLLGGAGFDIIIRNGSDTGDLQEDPDDIIL